MKHEIYKDHYQFEWDHRSHLTSALNIPIAASTVLGGAVTVMAKSYPYENAITTYLFIGALFLAVACIGLAIVFLFKAFHGYQYKRIPTPLALKSYYDELLTWHNQYGNGKETADPRFEEYFNQRVAEATEVNALNNKNKSAYLYRCNTALAVAILFMAVSSVPYLIATINEKDKTYSVNVLSLPTVEGKHPKEKAVMPDNDPQPTTSEAPPEPPPEPVMPPNENIKEHVVEPVAEKIITERQE